MLTRAAEGMSSGARKVQEKTPAVKKAAKRAVNRVVKKKAPARKKAKKILRSAKRLSSYPSTAPPAQLVCGAFSWL